MNDQTIKIRVSRTVYEWMTGTHIYQLPDEVDRHGYGWAGQHLGYKLRDAVSTRKDRSVVIELFPQEAVVLMKHATTMRDVNGDEFESFGDHRAGAGLVRSLAAVGIVEPPRGHTFGTDPNPYDDDDDHGDDGPDDGGPDDDSPRPICPTCGCYADGWRADGPRAIRGGHGCSRGDECPDCPTNAERRARWESQQSIEN